MGEEDRFYIENHHEAIISKEIFEKAQEIRQRRSKGRVNGVETGKRENIVDNMHSAVCWNVAFVERLYQGDVGIVIQNTKKLYGIVEGI